MKFRFNIQDAVYDNNVPTLCLPTVQSDYNGISGNITVNGVSVADFIDLATGTFITTGFPFDANGITVTNITLENSLYVNVEVDLLNLWDEAEVKITLNKTGFYQLVRTFLVYGYDIGQNPNIAITLNNPEAYLVMIPSEYPATFATTGDFSPAIGYTFNITADNPGTIGNGIQIIADGISTIDVLINNWNIANPTNAITLTVLVGDINYIPSLETYTLLGGGNAPIQLTAYANFIGWRKPFCNNLLLFANYSNLNDKVEYYNTEATLAQTHIATLTCYTSTPIYMVSRVYTIDACDVWMLADECIFGPKDIPTLSLIPTFSSEVSCVDCCTDDCLVVLNDNYVQFIVDITNIDTLNVDDVEVISTETVDLVATLVDSCGNTLDKQSTTISLNPLPLLEDMRVSLNLPDKGDYIVSSEIKSGAFLCKKNQIVESCLQYELIKLECGEFNLKNLSLASIEYVVEQFEDDKTWSEVTPATALDRCETANIKFTVDGVYRIVVNGEVYKVAIVDCKFKECYVNYVKQRVCKPKVDCACGGNCNGLCNKVPIDLYDFNAFMLLAYNYFALLNGLYIKNYTFTIFKPADIDTLFTIKNYLKRVEEYCGNCPENNVSLNSGDCGCSK